MIPNISSYFFIGFVVVLMSIVFVTTVEGDPEPDSSLSSNKRPFFVGSRYGRSPQQQQQQQFESKTRRLNIVPRNDRFFLGSRYGKRNAENLEEVYEQDSSNQSNIFTKMSCIYTGFKNFYRCNNNINDDLNNFVDQQPRTDDYVKK